MAGVYVGAGEATFTNTLTKLDNIPCYHLQGEGHSYESYDWFYKVRDLYESYLDTTSLLPKKFIRKVQEANHRNFNSVIFNHPLNRAVSTNGVFKIPDCTQDVLSAIYYARNIDFSQAKIGQKFPFNIFLDDKVEPVYITYLGKEVIKNRFGVFNTIKFRPKLLEGTIFTGGEEMIVYVSDDQNKVPLYVETPILVGKIKVYLIHFENLKHKTRLKLNKS